MNSADSTRAADHDTRLAYAVAASCRGADANALVAALARNNVAPADYEASVRGGAGHPLSAGRMMIERATPALLDAVAATLDVALPPAAAEWIEHAGREGVRLIVGWDRRGDSARRCVKLYINASDAAQGVRSRLRGALIPKAAACESPAVLGMNMSADGSIETKLYVQSAEAPRLAADLPSHARALAAGASREGADAGAVMSFDVEGATLRPRAFFIALRDPVSTNPWSCVQSLAGYDGQAIAALLPFAPAPPRSIGISLGGATWTLYYKPRDSGRGPEALEPVAIFRGDGAEVGLFIEVTEHAARAFRRTSRHAISIRERDGVPAPRAIESLVDWFALRLSSAERDGVSVVTRLDDPPAPWQLVGGEQG